MFGFPGFIAFQDGPDYIGLGLCYKWLMDRFCSLGENMSQATSRRRDLAALLLLVPLPSVGTLAALVWPATRGTAVGQGLYFFAKIWILLLPLLWPRFVEGQPIPWPPRSARGLLTGLVSGLLIGVVILLAFLLFGDTLVDRAFLQDQVARNGLNDPLRYTLLALYLCFINALLEEYVWRQFVFQKCETLVGAMPAVVLSAIFFTLHHVIALKAQFGLGMTILGSLGVLGGGLIWSWCYLRFRSLWPGYVSHILADIAIFAIGAFLIFGA